MAIVSAVVDPELLQRFGLVVTRWAIVEEYEGRFLAFLCSADQGAFAVVTAATAGSSITNSLRTLSEVRFTNEETKAGLAQLFTSIQAARDDRNAWVHGLWVAGPEPKTALVQTMRWSRAEVIKHELVTISDLDELANQIAEITSELHRVGVLLGFIEKPGAPVQS